MIRGNIAIPDKDPKSWRSRGRKKRKQPAVASAIVTSAPLKKRKGPVIRLDPHQRSEDDPTTKTRSAIVEPKRKPTSMLAHLLEEITEEERNRRADMAEEMFREICRRAALPD